MAAQSPLDFVLSRNKTLEHDALLARLRREIDIAKIFAAVDLDPDLVGAGVVYVDREMRVVELRPFVPLCRSTPVKVVLREAPDERPAAEFASRLQSNPRESRLVAETISAGLACTGAVLGWTVVFGSAAAIPFSAGASTVVTAIGTTAAFASTIQCFNGLARTYNEWADPSRNDYFDDQAWYTNTSMALDALSLAGAGASGLTTVRMVLMAKKTTGKSTLSIVRGLNRTERTRLTRELQSVQNPHLSNAMLKAMRASGELPKRLSRVQLKDATVTQIRDAISATLALAGSASAGVVKSMAIGVFEGY